MDLIINRNNIESLRTWFHKKKENHDLILDPLQMMYQIALVSYCPIGTKVSINENLIEIQSKDMTQGMLRWMSNDTKYDLYHLYNGFVRFNKYYNKLKSKYNNFYALLINRVIIGLDKLKKTYQGESNMALLQGLEMFKDVVTNETSVSSNDNNDSIFKDIVKLYNDDLINMMYYNLKIMDSDKSNYKNYLYGINKILKNKNKEIKRWIRDNVIV